MGIETALIAGGIAAAGSVTSAIGSSKAQKDAAKKNQRNADLQNAQNYGAYQEARGSTGYSILPLYAKGTGDDGPSMEIEQYRRIREYYHQTKDQTPEEFVKGLRSIQSDLADMGSQALRVGSDLFSGKFTDDILNDFKDLEMERIKSADATRSEQQMSVQEELNRIKASMASKGFLGDAFGENLLKARTSAEISGKYARERGDVNVQNATDRFQIEQAGRQLQLNNLDLSSRLGQQALNTANFTQMGVAQRSALEMEPFNQFRLPYDRFQYGDRPQVQPVQNGWQIGGDLVAGLGTSYVGLRQAQQRNDLLSNLLAQGQGGEV